VFNLNRNQKRPNVKHRARFLAVGALALFLSSNVGCFIPIYDADPAVRARQLINTSEDLRALREEWQRFWFLDQPSHMTPTRTHGGII
jgi:hypothetical protein